MKIADGGSSFNGNDRRLAFRIELNGVERQMLRQVVKDGKVRMLDGEIDVVAGELRLAFELPERPIERDEEKEKAGSEEKADPSAIQFENVPDAPVDNTMHDIKGAPEGTMQVAGEGMPTEVQKADRGVRINLQPPVSLGGVPEEAAHLKCGFRKYT